MEYLRAVLRKMAVDVDNIPLLVLVGEGEAVIPKSWLKVCGKWARSVR